MMADGSGFAVTALPEGAVLAAACERLFGSRFCDFPMRNLAVVKSGLAPLMRRVNRADSKSVKPNALVAVARIFTVALLKTVPK